MRAQKPSVPTKIGKHEGKRQICDMGKEIAYYHKVVYDILDDGKSDDVETCDVKKGESLLSKRRRVTELSKLQKKDFKKSNEDDKSRMERVYVADHVVNDKKKSIKRATKEKAIAGCDKVFTDVVVEADNYVKPIYSTVKSNSLSSKRRRVYKVVTGDVDLIVDDNKVIKLDDSISKFDKFINVINNMKMCLRNAHLYCGNEKSLIDLDVSMMHDKTRSNL
nr:hypothetical protein [Tanacetum cinerariifolium]